MYEKLKQHQIKCTSRCVLKLDQKFDLNRTSYSRSLQKGASQTIAWLVSKSVSKVSRYFAFFVNIFPNFNATSDFPLPLNSYGHNQPRKIIDSSIEKWRWKIFRFQMRSFLAQIKHMVRIPSLCRSQICIWYFHPATYTP